jgi:hypothetical protein
MKTVAWFVAVSAVGIAFLSLSNSSKGKEGHSSAVAKFETAIVRFEQNETDGDVEAVFEAIGNDDGLSTLKVEDPNGHTVCEFNSKGAKMGIREFHFESPEPVDTADLKKAFPEGQYTFTATTSAGDKLESKTKLTHELPPTTTFIVPKAHARNVSPKNLKISWSPVPKVAGYTLELSPSKSSAHVEVKLPPSTTSFLVPEGILEPGGECQLGIGTVSAAGNVSVIETTFTVAD